MTPEAWFVAFVVVVVLFALWKEIASPSVITFAGVVSFMVVGIISPAEAFAGFSNPAPITVAALFVVASAVSKTGAIDSLTGFVLGRTGHTRRPMIRLLAPSMVLSGFVNNIPLVAMLIPRVGAWARQRGSDASRFLMPLSFGVILGGMLTVIGTSTNLVVSGKMADSGMDQMSFFETGLVGLPIALIGFVMIVAIAPRVLYGRKSTRTEFTESRQYTVEMVVSAGGPVAGKTVAEAGLRSLKGVFLVSVERAGLTITPAQPDTRLEDEDTLIFAGEIAQILDLQRIPGLTLGDHRDASSPGGSYFTVVVGADSPLLGKSLKELGFRAKYQAAVVAIHRADHRIDEKLGGVRLRLGDTLVVIADAGFGARWQNRSDFLIVAAMDSTEPPTAPGAGITLAVLIAMIALAAMNLVPILQGSLVAAMALIALRVLTADEARRAVDLEVIGVIASAFGLAAAVETSGLASSISSTLVDLASGVGAWGVLFGVVLSTVLITELVTNNAAALLLFPVAISAAPAADVTPRGMAVAVAIAASASFLTPIGYQTNTMVYGPGGYRFSDYTKLGLPITLMTIASLVILIPMVYPA